MNFREFKAYLFRNVGQGAGKDAQGCAAFDAAPKFNLGELKELSLQGKAEFKQLDLPFPKIDNRTYMRLAHYFARACMERVAEIDQRYNLSARTGVKLTYRWFLSNAMRVLYRVSRIYDGLTFFASRPQLMEYLVMPYCGRAAFWELPVSVQAGFCLATLRDAPEMGAKSGEFFNQGEVAESFSAFPLLQLEPNCDYTLAPYGGGSLMVNDYGSTPGYDRPILRFSVQIFGITVAFASAMNARKLAPVPTYMNDYVSMDGLKESAHLVCTPAVYEVEALSALTEHDATRVRVERQFRHVVNNGILDIEPNLEQYVIALVGLTGGERPEISKAFGAPYYE